MNSKLSNLVRRKLVDKWSPKQISGYLKQEFGIVCSSKAIYRFVEHHSLERYLFWSWNKHKTGPKSSKTVQNRDNRKRIDERPVVDSIGHYEVDFIVSKHNTWVLLVVVDIYSRYTRIRLLANRKSITIRNAFSELCSGHEVKSITTDNDIAFHCWEELETSIQALIYFCYPYHSWEKGLVENTNRWIRCFVPKKYDLSLVTQSDLDEIHSYLNDRPRECIGFKFPSVVYYQYASVLIGG